MRTAIYACYSSDLQSDASIEDQVRLCRERITSEGGTIGEVYSDHAISGASMMRPGLQALMQDAAAGRFDVVHTEALDRLSRDQEDIAAIHKRLSFAGVRIVTLSEGEIGQLHIGVMGMMNAKYLSDLADKTRRGLRGRVEAGRSGGGNSYGYDVIRKLGAKGEPEAGERAINRTEADVVLRIYEDYANGQSPRTIARTLNTEGGPGPTGKGWSASTIHGNPKRGTGILNNELYAGRLVWNRLRYVKDLETGRRVSRLNPEADWIVRDVPELRIVPKDLWDPVKARQSASSLPQRSNRGAAMGQVRRARYLFSGMLTCGDCGGGMSVISATHVGCSAARNKGTCANRKTIARREIEDRVLGALGRRLMDPDLFAVFCEAFTQEMNRLRREAGDQRETLTRDLAKIDRDLERLVQALIDGVPAAAVKTKMETLEARKVEIDARLEHAPEQKPALHPAMAEIYRVKVERLSQSLNAPDLRAEAVEILRGLVETITLTPEKDGYGILLKGDLAGILTLAAGNGNARAAAGGAQSPSSQVSLVAGAGFEPATFRL